jgi:acyl carrier protein
MNTVERVKKILQEELHLDKIKDDAKQADHGEWDSMTYMSIVARVQDEFGVEATPENIESFGSVADIVREIGKKKN